jgi:anti-sigma regulatory factor (Ser/Thr protein kinase)
MPTFGDVRPGELVIATSPQMLQDLFGRLRPLLAPAERDGFDTSRVYLLLDEILSNIHRHGYAGADGQPIGIRVRLQAGYVHLAVRDHAPTFDCAAHAATRTAPPPESAQPGGMGLFLVRNMCDSFVHRVPLEGGNAVYAVMKLPRRPGTVPVGAAAATGPATNGPRR